ncbi:MAG: geopeptide radical SAM maturase [Desulfobacterales bacterium]|nr:geopeptide radical SAM maturase [Desulfobacterales bacterium]
MEFSQYLKIFDYEKDSDMLLLYSTKQTSLILIPKETFSEIEKGEISSENEALLISLGMVVPDRNEEKELMLGFFDNLNDNNTGLHILTALNLDCNFSCTYCYEEGLKGKYYMSDETAERLIDFIKEKFSLNKKHIRIDFHGGEPLLSLSLIQHISEDLKAFAEQRGASYEFTVTTNGSLFTRKTAQSIAHLGMKSVKVTLDGPAFIHNKSRPFKSGCGSFDTIIKNLQEICDITEINIGGNYDRNNYEKFILLFDEIEKAGLTPDKIGMVKFDPVIKHSHNESGWESVSEPWIINAEKLLREEVLKRGYAFSKLKPIPCMVEFADSFVVNYDGSIYKCPIFIGKKGFSCGDIYSGISGNIKAYKPSYWKENRECHECVYLPLCFGGCRFFAYMKDSDISHVSCKKKYFDNSLEIMIKQELKYARHSSY